MIDKNTQELLDFDKDIKKKAKNRERALKAWNTIKKRKKFSNHTKNYNVDNKNKFRNVVINSFKKIDYWTDSDDMDRFYGRYCLVLESPDFLFVNNFKKKFIVVEHNYKQYTKMCSKLPKQVSYIYYNDLSLVRQLPHRYSCAFIDFCRTFDSLKKLLEWIKPTLLDCQKIAFTFSLRKNKKEMEDYKFDLVNKLQKLLPDFDIEYGNAYRDGAPMIGIILSNRKEYVKPNINKNEIQDWCNIACKKQFGHKLYEWGDPIINPRASVNRITNFEKCKWLFDNLPLKYKKEVRSWSKRRKPVRYSAWNSKIKHGGALFDYFVDILS